MKRLLIALVAVLMLYTVTCFMRYYTLPPEVQAQTNTFCAANLACTVTGAWALNAVTNLTVSGTLNCKTVETGVRCVDAANTQGWTGSDFGAWVNSAFAAAGNSSVVWAFGPATNTTAINLTGNQQVLVLFPGTFTASASWTASGVGSGFTASHACSVRTAGAGLNLPPVLIKQANSINLSALVTLSGQVSFLECIGLDGNKANNPTGTIGILVNKAGGVHAHSFTAQNFSSHGVQVLSTSGTKNNESDTFKAWDFQSSANNGHGISCVATNDMFLYGGFETNGDTLNGVDLNDCGAARLWDGDIGFSVDGVKMYGTIAGNGSSSNDIQGIHFSGNSSHDVNLQGWDTVGAAIANQNNTICNNQMIGSLNVADNVNPSILIQDSQGNIICNNRIASQANHRWKWLIQMLAVNESVNGGNDTVSGNQGFGTAGTGAGAPTGGITALVNNNLSGNSAFLAPVGGQQIVLANNSNFSAYNTSGVLQGLAILDSGNNAIFGADSTAHFMAWRPNGIGSGTNQWSLVPSGLTTGGSITLGASTGYNVANLWEINTAPTIAAAGCGGSAASLTVTNGTAAFKINVGTAPGSVCTITMPAATTGWNCSATDITTNSTSVFLQKQTGAESATQVVITNFNDVAVATAFVASDILKVACSAD